MRPGYQIGSRRLEVCLLEAARQSPRSPGIRCFVHAGEACRGAEVRVTGCWQAALAAARQASSSALGCAPLEQPQRWLAFPESALRADSSWSAAARPGLAACCWIARLGRAWPRGARSGQPARPAAPPGPRHCPSGDRFQHSEATTRGRCVEHEGRAGPAVCVCIYGCCLMSCDDTHRLSTVWSTDGRCCAASLPPAPPNLLSDGQRRGDLRALSRWPPLILRPRGTPTSSWLLSWLKHCDAEPTEHCDADSRGPTAAWRAEPPTSWYLLQQDRQAGALSG